MLMSVCYALCCGQCVIPCVVVSVSCVVLLSVCHCCVQDGQSSGTTDTVVVVGAASKGIIQRDHQHDAVVYKQYYASNPFDSMTEADVERYKAEVERRSRGRLTQLLLFSSCCPWCQGWGWPWLLSSLLFSFLSSLLYHYVLYRQSPTPSIVCCCSPFSSHSF